MDSVPSRPSREAMLNTCSDEQELAGSDRGQTKRASQSGAEGSTTLGKKGSLISMLGQNIWAGDDLRAMSPSKAGYETEQRSGAHRRRSSFLQSMADYLAYSSTLESNSGRPQCPIPQGPASRRPSGMPDAEGDDDIPVDDDEVAMYVMRSASRRQSVAPIVAESSIAASAVSAKCTRPAVERAAAHQHQQHHQQMEHQQMEQQDCAGQADDEEYADDAAASPRSVPTFLLEQQFTFAPMDEAQSPSRSPTRSPTHGGGGARDTRSPELRRRRRASVSTPFETICEEREDSDSAPSSATPVSTTTSACSGATTVPASIVIEPRSAALAPTSPGYPHVNSPLDFPSPKPPVAKRATPTKRKAPLASSAAPPPQASAAVTQHAHYDAQRDQHHHQPHHGFHTTGAAPNTLAAMQPQSTMQVASAAQLSAQELVALRQLYEQLHAEQQELLREARFWRRAELVAVSAAAAVITAAAFKYLL
ncbi:hypothetical protein PTSG_03610 [Salpingoeca rosetta]|uniref:Uncharacterized protein n=1 Tax=Salpingoeca rosetta (strain ATCC 50818 / BSB-021) TaxID=946362 RepID=F2U632_SALR5|nr:uncharacterized protein PTSG_03610 [Salpingoeca rosetta]EGD82973.1 hypothetical protein PTSG_03610 [Salpingoeca rosetta]|eukprot:XP_004995337.1 hypothetical protein PTSG_03610 [Salpingoeca rosetta]